jgi:hypothetical protein
MSVGYASHAPRVETLWRQTELSPDHVVADFLDDEGVGVQVLGGHTAKYQHSVYIASGQTFIGLAAALMHKLRVAHDPEFGERLRRLIPMAGYKNPRRFAIDAMGWPETAGPQRLNGYMKGRIPDVETLVQMSEELHVSVADLLGLHDPSSSQDEGLKGILQNLLVLEGIAPDKADTIASTSLAAQRLLRAFPDEEPLPTRAKFAARAAWLQQQPPATGR